MSNYFYACKTLEEGKKVYRHLAKKLHPDLGGSSEAMAELTREWEKFQVSQPIHSGSSHKEWRDQYFNDSKTNWANQSQSTSDRFGWRAPNAGANFYSNDNPDFDIAKLKMKLMVYERENKALKDAQQELYSRLTRTTEEYKELYKFKNELLIKKWSLELEVESLKKQLKKEKSKKKSDKPKRKYTKRTKVVSPENDTIYL